MNCRKVSNLLSAYIDGELPGVERIQIQQHMRYCETCSEEYDSLLFTKRLLAGLAMKEPAADLEKRILRCIAVEGEAGIARYDLRAWWSFLSYPQRRCLRMGVVCATASLSALLLVASPFGANHETPGMVANFLPSAPAFDSDAMVRRYQSVHDASPLVDGQPFGRGVSIQPVSASEVTLPPVAR